MDESLHAQAKRMLREYDTRARKSLGQHFLVNRGVLDKITEAAEVKPDDVVIEVGPGLGVLTDELADRAAKVIAIELDDKLSGLLRDKFVGNDKVVVLNQDVLKTDIGQLADDYGFSRYKVVANLPYYITSAVIRHFLESSPQPDSMVLMTQLEVARQITARPGDMSLLSVSVQLYGSPKILFKVPPASFLPPPGVDSAVLGIETASEERVKAEDNAEFFRLVKAGFSANRKQLVNTLSKGLSVTKPEARNLLESVSIDPRRRAETLGIPEWLELFASYREGKWKE